MFWFIVWLVVLTCITVSLFKRRETSLAKTAESSGKKILRGPKALPLIGSLHLLRDADGPFAAFTKLAEEFGEIYEIQLGCAKCVVVSSYKLLKEVLITKGHQFGGRPDFLRFHELFGGDRNNSLALCDWSDLQRKRRSLARNFCSPRGGSLQQEELSKIAGLEVSELLLALGNPKMAPILQGKKSLKPLLLASIANMFTRYMCSTRFDYDDEEFRGVVRSFDEIFWDINQGYAVDFLPWLKPFYSKVLHRLQGWSSEIRTFILHRIIQGHRSSLDTVNGVPKDFTDALLLHLESPESGLSWDHILFELEDFLGGHSAIGNLVMLILGRIAVSPTIQAKIQAECDTVLKNCDQVTLDHRQRMVYTDAVIWETLRISSSPIVPHVAIVDTNIDGYPVLKDTIVFINNYELNLGETYWGNDSKCFKPERFLVTVNDKPEVRRPEYFVPFSTGKRTCIGQRLVQGFAFFIISGLLTKFNVYPATDDLKDQLQMGTVAVHPDSFNLVLKAR